MARWEGQGEEVRGRILELASLRKKQHRVGDEFAARGERGCSLEETHLGSEWQKELSIQEGTLPCFN